MSGAFAGFGFGPIQAGLMLCEAVDSGSFSEYAVAEIDQRLVDAVRANGDAVSINIAGRAGIRTKVLEGIRLWNPGIPADRAELAAAARRSAELATAVPSVEMYGAGGEASIAAILAATADPDSRRIVYTAENNNFAAEALEKEVLRRVPADRLSGTRFLNTVIGKMSGVISSPEQMRRLGLAPIVPGYDRCVLVEEFNRILVSKVGLTGFQRGIRVFEEKEDLLPFEEAKLYGHNAVHALLGSLARVRGYAAMSQIRDDPRLMSLGREAFIRESGAALVRMHGPTGEGLFTEAGWAAYAEDLLERMTNPYLHDSVERIIRDPRRKLGWDDRFFGTMRIALAHGIEPRHMALGAAAAVTLAMGGEPGDPADPERVREYLLALWGAEASGEHARACISLVRAALGSLADWRA